ncbi:MULTISPECIES: polysaccharide pyruvyl transferase family protein [unclassified Fibrobacter]|uniref:polysaccharide pyruvyl transferase family protein n=1 Tax=unclassified Fibrobacter TaxID=2634177 RepID=UPI00091C5AE9|nr:MULTISPECIES: polysaccharide pyruvyl transferase family protein [unclassified Fibrobacter]OWV02729.1 hypothetical protein B7993_14775 [Fibrobacter sp. UWH3]SHK73487.1 Polysaccharide pyruvyl transferase [Fibrobacter sp. UWH6]
MKKIGCVIAYRKGHTNYGTALVGYALLKKILQLGFQVEVINYVKRLSVKQKVAFVLNAILCGELKCIVERLTSKRVMKKYPRYAAGIKERTAIVEAYKEKKLIPLFRDFVGYSALHEGSKQYDAVVVGSDQVWTPMSLPNKFFNLLFVSDSVRKVAYASSFGVSVIPNFQKEATGKYLDRFYKIGVREQKGKEIVDSLSHQVAQVVADPTMLLNAEEWREEIFAEPQQVGEPYIFCYFLGNNQEARKAANELKAKTGFKIVTLRHMDEYVPEDESFGDEAPYDVDPDGFLRLIHNASYVCTDSFHCSVFSIQFHKQFMTFYRFAQGAATGRNSRIDSLFSVLGINRNRLYQGDVFKIDEAVDWNVVDEKLRSLREESIRFLRESLS